MSVKPYELTDAGGATCQGMITVDGYPVPNFMEDGIVRGKTILSIREWKIRDDDIVVKSLPKSGNRWVDEILNMLLSRKTEMEAGRKFALIEQTTEKNFESTPSPRVISTHLPLRYLPKQLEQKKTKMVLVLRNPKDCAVSYYHVMTGMRVFNYSGKFENFLKLYIDGKLPFGDMFSYIREFEEKMNSESDKICLVMYEDLKMNGVQEIQRLARFLGVDATEEFCKTVHDACSFRNFAEKREFTTPVNEMVWKEGGCFYRKGIIGDWKNHFTVADSEMFDEVLAQRMTGSKLKFTYSAPE
ncbi:sulfotransferase 1B1-like [Dreissena polymorpha]|uniref:Sulfotransferase domain-containing protein n=1 Tax=Dreissena polymorpha TaxID=45954 RepID=A0A9D4D586_DREPO|nr:sulfotransferase 1B1-like [Dreissena polymorpha]KAH3739273.1 hypothetical protein DPMN_045923 [Dreissena polymorpha]